ncbi:MAG: response regulator [Nitrospirae bacterium]|jgi:CheY-like chemotaxis protein|nr:response regulator [Nitrospirota bacterium]
MKKILIVDDDPIIRNLLEQILEPFAEKDIEILIAENGLVALDIIKEKQPELIFLDVMMPKMNGFEVCQKIKNNPTDKIPYIIMLTAKGQETDKEKAKASGADCYITKPFNINDLLNKVSEILQVNLN